MHKERAGGVLLLDLTFYLGAQSIWLRITEYWILVE